MTTPANPEHPALLVDPAVAEPDEETGLNDVAPTRGIASRLDELLRPARSAWWIGIGFVVVIAGLWGLLAGWWTPRGPLTTAQALWSMLISLTVGAVAGVVSRSRWAMLAAPVAFAAVFEATRIGTDGPTVDGIAFSTYGLLALAVGRGFHALVALVPMILGVAVGAGVARHLSSTLEQPRRSHGIGRYLRRGVAVLTTIGLAALAAGIARPAHTDAIVGSDGDELAGSIAELTTVDINGHDLAMMIRGHSVDNPVLLFLAGGPGGSELGAMRRHLPALEEHFTVVIWDQRGTGKSYPQLDPTDTLTLDSEIADTIAVTNYLRDRFDQDKIYLLGQSWGSTLGVLAVQQRPELYRAFIGTGQMVSQLTTDRIFYDDTLAWARANGNDGLVATLTDIGPPPYGEMLNYETNLSYEHEVYPYDHTGNSEGEGGFSENFFVEEYTLIEQVHLLAAFMDTFAVLYPQLQDIDFRRTATTFEIPVYFVQGAHEAAGRAQPFDEWYPMIDAPIKDRITLATSGHRPLFEQPAEFIDYMTNTVLTDTRPN